MSTMLTPSVMRSLPRGWQGAYTIGRAKEWIRERDREGATLLVLERSSETPVGLLILDESDDGEAERTVRIGYLLSESAWGRGLASELVQGFVTWSRAAGVETILGGVGCDNVASQRVLEKNGFDSEPGADDSAELLFRLRLQSE